MPSNKDNQKEIEIINVDDQLHKTIVSRFIHLMMLDVASCTLIAMVCGYFAFRDGFHLLPGVFFAISVFVVLWNVWSVIRIAMRQYTCCYVKVDKLWEEKGVLKCRVTPDVYQNYDFTGDINVKNYTKDLDSVSVGDKVIVVAGNFSRYIYLFNYTGDRYVTERRNIMVTENESFVASREYEEKYHTNRGLYVSPYFGKLVFDIYGNAEDNPVYDLAKGFKETPFGPFEIEEIEEFCVTEENLESVITLLENTYKNSDQILQGLYDLILKTLDEEKLATAYDNEIDVHYIKKCFAIEQVLVRVVEEAYEDNDVIAFYGRLYDKAGEAIFDDRTFRIAISCITSKVTYELDYF